MSNDSNQRPMMSTSNVAFPLRSDEKNSPSQSPGKHCHILVLGDFSGRRNGRTESAATLLRRKIIEIDRDNFDDVFAAMKVTLQLPIMDGPVTFGELDDMHPDTLYEHVSLFNRLRTLRKQLQSNATFPAAAAEMTSWFGEFTAEDAGKKSHVALPNKAAGDVVRVGASQTADLLDAILSGAEVEVAGPEYDMEKLARSIVAPFLTAAPDPRQADMIAAVDNATSDLMRKIMHVSDFQRLESSWQNLYRLVRRLETDAKLKVFVCDLSQSELSQDAAGAIALEDTQAYRLLVSSRQSEGAKNFSVIMADYIFQDMLADIRCAGVLAGIANAVGGAAVSGGSEKLAGCVSLAQTPDVAQWNYKMSDEVTDAWRQLRSSSVAANLSLAAPRVLSRLPFGKRTSQTNAFDFEEIPAVRGHEYYLWGNGGWLVTLLIAQNYSQIGWAFVNQSIHTIDNLPLHVYTDDEGDSCVLACAEIAMTDQVALTLRESGLSVIRSILNKDAVLIPAFTSVAQGEVLLRGPFVAR